MPACICTIVFKKGLHSHFFWFFIFSLYNDADVAIKSPFVTLKCSYIFTFMFAFHLLMLMIDVSQMFRGMPEGVLAY